MGRHLVLGTAGHIDHGKTALVRCLTGIDADRLPEEKRRGITIDLGYAHLDLLSVRFSIVDVPGHERFIRNMVAGAVGIDLGLLVIAADDSVMPQTREHLAILELLGIRSGLVAVTKRDLVDDLHFELVCEEIRELVAGTFLENRPIVGVSSVTGEGIESLRDALEQLATIAAARSSAAPFRMPIDRSFTVKGHGAVATGTVMGGAVRTGDALVLVPIDRSVRVRGIQSHSTNYEMVQAGQRAAINLVGARHDEIQRGFELCEPGFLEPSRRFLVHARLLQTCTTPLRPRSTVRLLLGTQETSVRIVGHSEPIAPGQAAMVELRTASPVVAEYGQRFILRRHSPAETIGGGVVLDPALPKRRLSVAERETLKSRMADSPSDRLAGFLQLEDVISLTPLRLAARIGVSIPDQGPILERLAAAGELLRLGTNGVLLHRHRFESLAAALSTRLQKELGKRKPSVALERSLLMLTCARLAPAPVLQAVIDAMVRAGRFSAVGERIAMHGHQPSRSKQQQVLLESILAELNAGLPCPPVVVELSDKLGRPAKELENLARSATDEGMLCRLAPGMYFPIEAMEEMRFTVVERLKAEGPATVAKIRDWLKLTRKYAVPLCEYFDAAKITLRHEDLRSPGPNAENPLIR